MTNTIIKQVPSVFTTKSDGTTKYTLDGIDYEIQAISIGNVGGYAIALIKDVTQGREYLSYGMVEINSHIFYTKWNRTYDDTRNYPFGYSRELLVEIY